MGSSRHRGRTPRRPTPPRSGCRLQRVVQPLAQGSLQRRSIEGDTQLPTPGDSGIARREQVRGECECVTDAEAKLEVQLMRERQLEEGVV